MKIRITQRAALVLGLNGVARDLGRARRMRSAVRDRIEDKIASGRFFSAACLAAFYMAGL